MKRGRFVDNRHRMLMDVLEGSHRDVSVTPLPPSGNLDGGLLIYSSLLSVSKTSVSV